jgi:hypothetical protein
MTLIKKVLLVICSLLLVFSFTACKKEGPAERAGEKIDETVEKAGEKMEEAGEEMKETSEKAGEKIEEAGEEVKEATEK